MDVQQQEFLRDAMRRLSLTRDAFVDRIGVSRRALDTWLLPEGSPESRKMPEIVQRFVSEISAPSQSSIISTPMQGFASKVVGANGSAAHLLSVDQFSRDSVEALLRVADIMQPIAHRQKFTRVLEGAVLANLFFEASTRTRLSFSSAFARLGGSVCDTTGFTFSSMAKGESIQDTSRVISGYADAIVVRHPEQGSVAEFAQSAIVPVINGGDGIGEHPSQALLDLYTIQREFALRDKTVDGSHIAFVGDLKYGRTVHSLGKLLGLYKNLKFTLVSPPSLEMPRHIIEALALGGHSVGQSHDLKSAITGADVIYATRIQKERFNQEETVEGYTADFQINQALVNAFCGPSTLIMHPLPRDGRAGANDLSTDLDQDPRLAIFKQTDNGIPVRMAIFATLLGVEHMIEQSMRDVAWGR